MVSVLEEPTRWQFDGGTASLKESRSNPVLGTTHPSLALYLQKHLPEFGFADLGVKVIDSDAASASASETGKTNSSCSDGDTSSSEKGFQIKFQLEDFDSSSSGSNKGEFLWDEEEDSLDSLARSQNYSLNPVRMSGSGCGRMPEHKSLSMIELQRL